MLIKWSTTWLADETQRAFNIALNGQRMVQEAQFLRAASAAFYSRGNSRLHFSASVNRSFASIKLAEQFMLSHWGTLADKASLTLRTGQPSETVEDVVCQNSVLESVQFPRIVGCYVECRYSWVIPAVTGIVTSPSDDEVVSGSVSIASGASSVTVTGLGLDVPPTYVWPVVRIPSGGNVILASPIDGTYSTDGFQVALSAATDSADYDLDYTLFFS